MKLALLALALLATPALAEPLQVAANTGPADRFASGGASSILPSLGGDPLGQLASVFAGDVDEAQKLATSIPDLQDGNGAACWKAGAAFAAVVKAHPSPLSGHAVTDLEAARLTIAAAERLCSNPACNQVFAELANGMSQLSPVPLPVPSLSSLCAKVPHIALTPAATGGGQ